MISFQDNDWKLSISAIFDERRAWINSSRPSDTYKHQVNEAITGPDGNEIVIKIHIGKYCLSRANMAQNLIIPGDLPDNCILQALNELIDKFFR